MFPFKPRRGGQPLLDVEFECQTLETICSESWDSELCNLNGHPLQSTVWAKAKLAECGVESLFIKGKIAKDVILLARLEIRMALGLVKIAWIPRGPVWASLSVKLKYEGAFLKHVKSLGFVVLAQMPTPQEDNEKSLAGSKTIAVSLKESLDDIAKRIDRQWMYGVRKAAKNGVEICEAVTAAEVSEFFSLCKKIEAEKDFIMPGNVKTFEELHRNRSKSQSVFVLMLLAKVGQDIAGGALLMVCGKSAHYFWGAVDRRFSRQRVGEAVQWGAITALKELGCTMYDLEGVDKVRNPGVYAFKKKMGGHEMTIQPVSTKGIGFLGLLLVKLYSVVGRLPS